MCLTPLDDVDASEFETTDEDVVLPSSLVRERQARTVPGVALSQQVKKPGQNKNLAQSALRSRDFNMTNKVLTLPRILVKKRQARSLKAATPPDDTGHKTNDEYSRFTPPEVCSYPEELDSSDEEIMLPSSLARRRALGSLPIANLPKPVESRQHDDFARSSCPPQILRDATDFESIDEEQLLPGTSFKKESPRSLNAATPPRKCYPGHLKDELPQSAPPKFCSEPVRAKTPTAILPVSDNSVASAGLEQEMTAAQAVHFLLQNHSDSKFVVTIKSIGNHPFQAPTASIPHGERSNGGELSSALFVSPLIPRQNALMTEVQNKRRNSIFESQMSHITTAPSRLPRSKIPNKRSDQGLTVNDNISDAFSNSKRTSSLSKPKHDKPELDGATPPVKRLRRAATTTGYQGTARPHHSPVKMDSATAPKDHQNYKQRFDKQYAANLAESAAKTEADRQARIDRQRRALESGGDQEKKKRAHFGLPCSEFGRR